MDDANAPKCCGVFPIKVAVYIIGVLSLGVSIAETVRMVAVFGDSQILGCFCIPPIGMMFISLVPFCRFWRKDDKKTRGHLVISCSVMIFSLFILAFVWLFGAIFEDEFRGIYLLILIVSYVFAMTVWVYFRYVCKKWAVIGNMVGFRDSVHRTSFKEITSGSKLNSQ